MLIWIYLKEGISMRKRISLLIFLLFLLILLYGYNYQIQVLAPDLSTMLLLGTGLIVCSGLIKI